MRMGYLSFGHAGYIALGGYTSALLATKLGRHAVARVPRRRPVAGRLRLDARRGDPEAPRHLLQPVGLRLRRGRQRRLPRLRGVRGPAGIAAVPRPAFFGTPLNTHLGFYYVVLAVAWSVARFPLPPAVTRFGFTLLALRTRDTEALAESVGIDAARYKTIAFVVSCFFCGVMGAVHVHYLRFVSPFVFTFFLSTDLVIYAWWAGSGASGARSLGTRAPHRSRRAALRRRLLQEPGLRGRPAGRDPGSAGRPDRAAARRRRPAAVRAGRRCPRLPERVGRPAAPRSGSPCWRSDGITKQFGGLTALRDVDVLGGRRRAGRAGGAQRRRQVDAVQHHRRAPFRPRAAR